MFLFNLLRHLFFFFLTFFIISTLGFPIILDFLISFVITLLFKRKLISIIIFNSLIIIVFFSMNFIFGQNQKFEYFYRAHEKYKTKNLKYIENVSDKIYMRFGDIYVLDGGLNEKRELIKEKRIQYFKTDNFGLRNDRYKIDDADIILVGDSFISAVGTSQEFTPANILNDILDSPLIIGNIS